MNKELKTYLIDLLKERKDDIKRTFELLPSPYEDIEDSSFYEAIKSGKAKYRKEIKKINSILKELK
jgi:hypothetical protein